MYSNLAKSAEAAVLYNLYVAYTYSMHNITPGANIASVLLRKNVRQSPKFAQKQYTYIFLSFVL